MAGAERAVPRLAASSTAAVPFEYVEEEGEEGDVAAPGAHIGGADIAEPIVRTSPRPAKRDRISRTDELMQR
jgi:hypothetical protein